MNAILLALLTVLPAPPIGTGPECDVVILNHTQSAGWSYTQAVMIDDGKIVNVEWRPTFAGKDSTRWLLATESGRGWLVTVMNGYGEHETWRCARYVEAKTPDNDWMKRYKSE